MKEITHDLNHDLTFYRTHNQLFRVLVIYNFAGFVKRGEALEGKKSGVYFDGVAHTLQRKRKEKRFWVFPGKEIWHIIRSVIESMIYKGSLYITKT